jgi:hypothetical protein
MRRTFASIRLPDFKTAYVYHGVDCAQVICLEKAYEHISVFSGFIAYPFPIFLRCNIVFSF